jgi:glycosyltransferase involved in cell wall biosynthesis
MFFSIIVPLYNRPQEIDELLFTLTQQDYSHFEVLIIEDGSTKDAKEIVDSYQDKLNIQYLYKENEGQGFARNYGFERAKGDYFIIFDSDCLIPKDYLSIVEKAISNEQLDAYGGPDAAHSSFTPIQKAISYSMTSPFTTGGIRGNKKHLGTFHPRSFNMGISRRVWEEVGGFKLTRLGEDIEYSIRIQKAGFKTRLIPEAVVFHKRRTNLKQFYKQLHFFGRARINIFKHFPSELKVVHFFPSLFFLFILITIISNLLKWSIAYFCNFILLLYMLLLFFHAWSKTKSLKIGLLSILTSFIQLIAYGMGFIQDFFKKVILKFKFSKTY